jgi:hypothetical protein
LDNVDLVARAGDYTNLTAKSEIGNLKFRQLLAGVAGNITLTNVPFGVESISTRPL